MLRESSRKVSKSIVEGQEEQEWAEPETKRFFDSLSEKLDEMNKNQEKRHEEICSRFAAIEHNTTQLAKDFQSLKEGVNVLEDGLA